MAQDKHEFKLSTDEFNFLRQIASNDTAVSRLLLREESAVSDKLTIRLNRAQAEKLREFLTERLAATGFEGDYSPNKQGEMLETLIDRFYVSAT
jgi:hypothetical protein